MQLVSFQLRFCVYNIWAFNNQTLMRIKEITLKELSKEGDKEDPNLVAVLCHMGEGICYHNIRILNHVNNCNY